MTSSSSAQYEVPFEDFREEWLREVEEPGLSPFGKGQRFAIKMVTQWLDVSEDDDDMVLCDGSGDGGIDIACLRRAENDEDNPNELSVEGDTWYLVQSKYGASFQGPNTVVSEGRKVVATLAGENSGISEGTRQLLGRLDSFREQASERDRIILVFATDRAMTEAERQALDDVRAIGTERIGDIFDVEDISLNTLWEDPSVSSHISLAITGQFLDPDPIAGLRVGVIPLISLYGFLKTYQAKTGNLDKLYEKNVRQFLGGRKKVNRDIAKTLDEKPEDFGLYNNGITIVVKNFRNNADGSCLLIDPYIVNGCQTTRTIWDVLRQKLDSGGTGKSDKIDSWRLRADMGVVITKIVKNDDGQISNITQYTNSQNAVRAQDFLTLRDDVQRWADEMAEKYGIFLEVQRGGWDSRRAYQKNHPSERQFTEYVNAFNLIRVYGAGWEGEPGLVFGRSAPFLPGGEVFKRVTADNPINVDDLYAAYRLQQGADKHEFGRGAKYSSRRQTKPLYYFVVIELLRDILNQENLNSSNKGITAAFHALMREDNAEAFRSLLDEAINIIDEYMNQESDECVYKEPAFQRFNNDLNTFLKWYRLGKSEEDTPSLRRLLADYKRSMRRGGASSPRTLILQAIKGSSQ